MSVSRALGTVVITVHGELDQSVSALLARVLADVVDGQGNLAVVIDLRDLQTVDSAGLAVLADAARAAEARGGTLALSGPCPEIGDALRLFRLANLVVSRGVTTDRRFHPAGSDRCHLTSMEAE